MRLGELRKAVIFALDREMSTASSAISGNMAHTIRHSGWVTYFHNTDFFGFVTREDLLEQEYHFNATDLYAEGEAKVRPLQPVEFSVMETVYGRFIARDITGPNGQLLRYTHKNSLRPREQRKKKLTDLPGPIDQTHRGIVKIVNWEKELD